MLTTSNSFTFCGISQVKGLRYMSTQTSYSVLSKLDETYWILEEQLSSLIIEELNKQKELPLKDQNWLTNVDSDIVDSNSYIFNKYIPMLVQLRQFLIGVRVSQEVMPDFKLEIKLNDPFSELKRKSSYL